jgi:hypothetical protein
VSHSSCGEWNWRSKLQVSIIIPPSKHNQLIISEDKPISGAMLLHVEIYLAEHLAVFSIIPWNAMACHSCTPFPG